MVETMHDGLRMAMSGLRTDVQDGMTCCELDVLVPNVPYLQAERVLHIAAESYRHKLSCRFDRRFSDCEVTHRCCQIARARCCCLLVLMCHSQT